jgi:hypothetical protein
VDLYLHSPNMPSWRGAEFKKKHKEYEAKNLNLITSLQHYPATRNIRISHVNNKPFFIWRLGRITDAEIKRRSKNFSRPTDFPFQFFSQFLFTYTKKELHSLRIEL